MKNFNLEKFIEKHYVKLLIALALFTVIDILFIKDILYNNIIQIGIYGVLYGLTAFMMNIKKDNDNSQYYYLLILLFTMGLNFLNNFS